MKTVLIFWEAKTSPKNSSETIISEPPHALKTWAWGQESPAVSNLDVNWKSPFHAELRHHRVVSQEMLTS